MLNAVQFKPFIFGVLTLGAIWAGVAIFGGPKTDYLKRAQQQIDSARLVLHVVEDSLNSVRTDIQSARLDLKIMADSALSTKNKLAKLQNERDMISNNINKTIEEGRSNLKSTRFLMDDILARQRALFNLLDTFRINKLIIEPSKKQ